jgi:hypothetical protein
MRGSVVGLCNDLRRSRKTPEMAVEGSMQSRVVSNDRIAARHYHEITAIQNAVIATKHVSDQTLQTISVDCPTGLLA